MDLHLPENKINPNPKILWNILRTTFWKLRVLSWSTCLYSCT